jgi:ComF family protein
MYSRPARPCLPLVALAPKSGLYFAIEGLPAVSGKAWRRVIFSSKVIGLTRIEGSGHRSTMQRLAATLRRSAEGLLAVLFPADCRLCQAPLWDVSRLPVCPDCLQKITTFDLDRCQVCGEVLDAAPAKEGVAPPAHCAPCRNNRPVFARALAYGPYEGALRDLIHLLKYDRVRTAARPLGALVAETLRGEGLEAPPLLVPVPLHRVKHRLRGFNQAEEIARVVRRLTRLPLEAGALVRRRPTASQTGMTNLQRRENVRGAFAVRPRARTAIAGRAIILVDDVMTTGATAQECARVLLRAGAAGVWVATAARVTRRIAAPGLEVNSEGLPASTGTDAGGWD